MSIDYPQVPEPFFSLKDPACTPPEESGIYFGWQSGVVAYVGQSVRLRARACLRHEKLSKCEQLSWLCFPVAELMYAECHYIGVLRPSLNGATPTDSPSVRHKSLRFGEVQKVVETFSGDLREFFRDEIQKAIKTCTSQIQQRQGAGYSELGAEFVPRWRVSEHGTLVEVLDRKTGRKQLFSQVDYLKFLKKLGIDLAA